MTQNLLKIYSEFRSDFRDSPDFTIDFYAKHSLFLNNITTFKDKEDLRLFIELSWQYLNATYRKDRFNDTVDNAGKALELIDKEISRLNAIDLKDDWYYGILFLKGIASYGLNDYKNATNIFKLLTEIDCRNDNYKKWLKYSSYGRNLWFVRFTNIIFGIMIAIGILFRGHLIVFLLLGLGVLRLSANWAYEYYIQRHFRKSTK